MKIRERIRNKLISRRGETFIEVLVAVLIIAFATLMVAALYSATLDTDSAVQKRDKQYYETLQKVEELDPSVKNSKEVSVTVTDHEVDEQEGKEGAEKDFKLTVDAYTGEGVTAFRAKEGS